jgi:large subunit ribosomal protein L27
MAHKKGGGSSKNGRDSDGKRLGIKRQSGEAVLAGTIIVRQRGTHTLAGQNVGVGVDHTLYATKDGVINFHKTGKDRSRVAIEPVPIVHVIDIVEAAGAAKEA